MSISLPYGAELRFKLFGTLQMISNHDDNYETSLLCAYMTPTPTPMPPEPKGLNFTIGAQTRRKAERREAELWECTNDPLRGKLDCN